jgi:carbon-monoxide dehydrogenase iron sulfur subunit
MRDAEKTIVLNPDKCTGCEICELTCSAVQELGFNQERARLHIVKQGLYDFSLDICELCEQPACVTSCPTHAIEVADGRDIVSITPADCTLCGRCVRACPHGALRLWRGRLTPAVCDFCAGHPQCVPACPGSALAYDFQETK